MSASDGRLELDFLGTGDGVVEVLELFLGDVGLSDLFTSCGENAKLERLSLPLKLAGAVELDAGSSSSWSSSNSSLIISDPSMSGLELQCICRIHNSKAIQP